MEVRTATIVTALIGSLLGGCGQANVYDMSPEEAYARLIQLKDGTPAMIEVEGVREDIYGTPGKSVTWVTDYAHSFYECSAYLSPEGLARTRVNVGCSDKNAPAKLALADAVVDEVAGEAMTALPAATSFERVRNRYIELVDSALDGRPFDAERARSQVMGWPAPPA